MIQKYNKEMLEKLCQESFSYAEVLKKSGRKPSGGNHSHLKCKIQEYGIDVSHFRGKGWSKGLTKETSDAIAKQANTASLKKEDVLVENSPYPRGAARKIVIKEKLIPYECAFCGNKGEWRGQVISLELDHIDGRSDNHCISNLRFLCPNCHATTDTYGSKNWKERQKKDL